MKKIFITFGFLAPLFLFGQVDRSIVPMPGKAPSINIKDSEVFKTANGMTVVLSENHKLPRVTFDLVMGSGPALEGNKAGLSYIAGELVMSGTSTMSKDELDAKIGYIGATLAASDNSLTLSCLTKHMPVGLGLMSDVLLNANFPQSEFERIVKQNESNLLYVKSDPTSMGDNVARKTTFPNHPFGEVMTEESLKNITLEDVKNYYKSKFVADGSYLVIVGDITRAEAEKVVDTYFAKWTGKMATKQEYKMPTKNSGNRVIFVNKPGAVQSYIQVTFPTNIVPGAADQIPLTVMNGILGGGSFGNRLTQNLREDKAYTYGCRSSFDIQREGSYFSAGGNFRNEVTDSAIVQMLYEIDHMSDGYVKDEELKQTKASMAGGFARSLESPATVARFALNIIQNKLSSDYYQTYLTKLDAVSKDDVLNMSQKYLFAKNCNIIVVGNEAVLAKIEQFDADGKIEKMDAFGNEVKEIAPADISADDLLKKYTYAVTQATSDKAVAKKLKKVKSVSQKFDFKMSQVPFPIQSTTFWAAPNSEGMKLEGGGMVVQQSYFDGKEGSETSPAGATKLSAEEIASKNKSMGLFPEMNYKTSGMVYELLGIENQNGTNMYVLKTNDGKTESFDYFDTKTFMKLKSYKITQTEEGPQESTTVYSDYKAVNGILFPHKMTIAFGEMAMNGEAKEILFNIGALTDFK